MEALETISGEQTSEAQVVVLPDEEIPLAFLFMKDRAHDDLSKIQDGKGRRVDHDPM